MSYMGLDLNPWNNPRAQVARWYRYRNGIKHNRPQMDALVEALEPFFRTCAPHYNEQQDRDYYRFSDEPFEVLAMRDALNRGTHNFSRGEMSLKLTQTVLGYLVENGHIEILESALRQAVRHVEDSPEYTEWAGSTRGEPNGTN